MRPWTGSEIFTTPVERGSPATWASLGHVPSVGGPIWGVNVPAGPADELHPTGQEPMRRRHYEDSRGSPGGRSRRCDAGRCLQRSRRRLRRMQLRLLAALLRFAVLLLQLPAAVQDLLQAGL